MWFIIKKKYCKYGIVLELKSNETKCKIMIQVKLVKVLPYLSTIYGFLLILKTPTLTQKPISVHTEILTELHTIIMPS